MELLIVLLDQLIRVDRALLVLADQAIKLLDLFLVLLIPSVASLDLLLLAITSLEIIYRICTIYRVVECKCTHFL